MIKSVSYKPSSEKIKAVSALTSISKCPCYIFRVKFVSKENKKADCYEFITRDKDFKSLHCQEVTFDDTPSNRNIVKNKFLVVFSETEGLVLIENGISNKKDVVAVISDCSI